MNDGSILKGEVISKEKETLKFKTSYAGTLNIKWDEVNQLQTEKVISLMLVTNELLLTQFINKTAKGMTQILEEGEIKSSFHSGSIDYINPEPWRLNNGYKKTGIANFSIKIQKGNTDKSEIDVDGNLEFRGLHDRFTLNGQLEYDRSVDVAIVDKWKLSSKYDRFIDQRRYYGIGLLLDRDAFTDLSLSTSLLPYYGYQFAESKLLNLRFDAGFSKVYENYINSENKDYFAANWSIDYDQYLFKEFTQFYHKQYGSWNLEETDKITLNSWTGFRFPLKSGIVASAEVEIEFDNLPRKSIQKSDRTFRLKLGYQW